MPSSSKALTQVRRLISKWPETSERLSHGAPTFWGGKKTFANFVDNHHGDGRLALWIKAPAEFQSEIVASDPERIFVPPYVGPSGWIGYRLEGDVDWDVVAGHLLQGYRMVAPKRALKKLDAERSAD